MRQRVVARCPFGNVRLRGRGRAPRILRTPCPCPGSLGFGLTPQSSRRLPYIGPRVGDEPVAVRHLDPRQGGRVHDVLLADDAVAVEQVGGHGIHLVGCEGAGVIVRLCPADVAPQRGGVLPKAPDRPHRLVCGQRALAADEAAVLWVLARLAVARGAPLRIHCLAEHSGPAARRQALAVGPDGEIPGPDLFGGGRRPTP